MSIAAPFEIEIVDLGDISGSPSLVWVRTQGGTDGQIRSNVSLKFNNTQTQGAAPVIVRGISPSLGLSIVDPVISGIGAGASGTRFSKYNDNWASDPDYSVISGAGYGPTNSNEAAFKQALYTGVNSFYLTDSGVSESNGAKRGRIDIIRPTGTGFWQQSERKSTNSGAWIQFNVSGEERRNLFAYTVEMVSQVEGSGAQPDFTGQDYKASEIISFSSSVKNGACLQVSAIIQNTGKSCYYRDSLWSSDTEDSVAVSLYEKCSSSQLSDSQISGIIASGLAEALFQITGIGHFLVGGDSSIETESNEFSYSVHQALLKFNYPYNGDSITVNPYSYDVTGFYQARYGVNPPYSPQNITLSYPSDYTDIDSFITAFNAALSVTGQYLWNRDAEAICEKLSLSSGYFESGALMRAYKSGSDHVVLESLRAGSVGSYQISLFEASRPTTGTTKADITKYLLPSAIIFEGSADGLTWNQVGSSPIGWKDAYELEASVPLFSLTGSLQDSVFEASSEPLPETPAVNPISGIVYPKIILNTRVSGRSRCGDYFERDVSFYQAQSPYTCSDMSEPLRTGGDAPATLVSGVTPSGAEDYSESLTVKVLRTGFKYTATGDYNFYRLYFSGLSSHDRGQASRIDNSIWVPRISLFGVESGALQLSGEECILGSDYTGRIEGWATGLLTGTLSGTANASGELVFSDRAITGNPGPVLFSYTSGSPSGAFTGLVSATVSGTGFYTESVLGYYYNTGTQSVYNYVDISGYITGSGNLTGGPFYLVRDSYVSNIGELTQDVSGYGYGYFTGTIPSFTYSTSDVPSFLEVSGTATGVVSGGNSGYYAISSGISIIPTGTVYSEVLSGTREARAVLAYGSPQEGDTVYVNGIPLVYSTGANNRPPLYYFGQTGFMSGLNSNASFGATGAISGGFLVITSTSLGESGNSVTLSYSGSVSNVTGGNSLSGGRNIYYELQANQPFTGELESGIYAVQYFTTSGSGYLTGDVKQLDFVRHFTGLWNIYTGDVGYRESGKISGNKYQNSGFETLSYFSGRPDYIPLTITYRNSPYVSSVDLVRLTVTGYDSNTGLSVIISGKAI